MDAGVQQRANMFCLSVLHWHRAGSFTTLIALDLQLHGKGGVVSISSIQKTEGLGHLKLREVLIAVVLSTILCGLPVNTCYC